MGVGEGERERGTRGYLEGQNEVPVLYSIHILLLICGLPHRYAPVARSESVLLFLEFSSVSLISGYVF
jgi:hypothetical protein